MPSNERLWYAGEAVHLAPLGSTTYTAAHGVQSCGMNVRFNLEQVFELGQAEIYENAERQPDVEVTIEKALDGYPLLWHLATNGAVVGTLSGRLNKRCQIGISVYSDLQDSASGTPVSQIVNSGMYPNSITYEMNTQGFLREQVSFVGNDRRFSTTQIFTPTTFNNADSPLAITGSGGVQQREDVIIGEGTGNASRFPTVIEGVTSSGTIAVTNGTPSVYLESMRVSANFNRQAIYSLGKRGACYRYPTVPVPVEATFEVSSKVGDNVTAYEEADNLTNERIYIVLRDSTQLDLGSRNKLESCSFTLGSAGGGGSNLAKTSYTFRGYNTLTVTHRMDPSGL